MRPPDPSSDPRAGVRRNLTHSQQTPRLHINLPRSVSLTATGFLLPVVAILFYYVQMRPAWSSAAISGLSLGAMLLSGVVLFFGRSVSLLSFAGIYFLYLSMAHLGIPFAELFVHDPFSNFVRGTGLWYYREIVPVSIAIAAIAVAAYTIAAAWFGRTASPGQGWPNIQERGNQTVYICGMLLLVASLAYMLAAIASDALPLFESYLTYWESMTRQPFYPWFLFALATGLPFALASGDGPQVAAASVVFVVVSILLLLSGNRGEVLYPLAAGLAVLRCRHLRFRLGAVLAFLLVFSFVIPVVRQLRMSAVRDWSMELISLSWIDPFVEIGFTLRPLATTVGWLETGEPLALGQTYLLPFQRLLGLALPLAERPTLENNPYFLQGRTEGLGYSVVGEAYFNFALIGVVVVMVGLGLALSRYGERGGGSEKLALLGAVFAVLVNNLRNSFIFVPAHIVAIFLLLAASRVVAAISTRNAKT